MFDFFAANADVVAYECYFNGPHEGLGNSIFDPVQNPLGSVRYASLW